MPIVIFFCALAGLWLGGTVGLVIGAVIGYILSNVTGTVQRQGLQLIQSQFLDTSFALMGALSKADGVVTQDEIRVTEQLFAKLRLSPEQQDAAKRAFTRGKAPDFDLEACVDEFARVARGS
ncbi:MAG TPA: TerB family tellurite resistance protein, partial [Polyangiaceae bacterium]|nr:TerB family tellurite resistance protein [Polyangiaceae bacterium]